MKRKIIKIDENKCTGCGLCVPDCAEGALQIIDGKARLMSDLFCDGLGACFGACPENAIEVIEREAEPYSVKTVIETMLDKPNVLKAHLEHLKSHGANEFLLEAFTFLKEKAILIPIELGDIHEISIHANDCPSNKVVDRSSLSQNSETNSIQESELRQWPIQLHLVPATAPFFKNREIVLISTCSSVASAEIHQKFIRGRAVITACPKLDRTEPYLDKLVAIFQESMTPKLIVVIMEVPCCRGLAQLAKNAALLSGRVDLALELYIMSLDGKIKSVEVLTNS